MKRCSTCNRTYEDPNLSFCIDDGTPLQTVDTDDDVTVVRPRDTDGNDWNAAAYQPPGSYVPPGSTEIKRGRRAWPWVVGIGGAFVLGVIALLIAGVFLMPRMMRSARDERAARNANRVENSNTNVATDNNSNANANQLADAPAPADHAQVLSQLTNLEQEWTVANLNADKKQLDRILADDFAGQGEKGQLESKADYIRNIERDQDVEKWEFSDLKLNLAGDRATLTGIITYFLPDRSVSLDFTDRFVWRDGRWQATGAEIKRRGTPDVDL